MQSDFESLLGFLKLARAGVVCLLRNGGGVFRELRALVHQRCMAGVVVPDLTTAQLKECAYEGPDRDRLG